MTRYYIRYISMRKFQQNSNVDEFINYMKNRGWIRTLVLDKADYYIYLSGKSLELRNINIPKITFKEAIEKANFDSNLKIL